MQLHPWRRIAAWCIDWLCISVWVGLLLLVGLALYSSGVTRGLPLLGANLLSFAILIVPVTIALAFVEGGGGQTPGKRALRLRVRDAASPARVGFGRALLRNTLKIALPWALGHAAVYAIVAVGDATEHLPGWLFALTAAAYLLPAVWIITLFIWSGRTPYDRAARTIVTTTKEYTMARPIPEYSIAELEKLNTVEFASMTNDDAVALGIVAVGVIRDWNLSLAVDILLGDDLVFRAKLKSTGPGNDPWLKGKAAVATHFGEPSLLVKARHQAAGTPFESQDFDHETMKAHGGSIPLRVGGTVVGTLTMSGEPDATDHQAAAEAISRYLGGPEAAHHA